MLLIDAYNVLHTVGVLPRDLAGLEVEDLAELIAAGRYRGRRVLLVCDGSPRPRGLREGFTKRASDRWAIGGHQELQIVFTGPESDADTFIEKYIEAETAPKRLLVVSSDRRIQKAGRRRRCPTLDSVGFLRQIVFDAEASMASTELAQTGGLRGEVPLKQAAIGFWKQEFGLSDDDAPKPAFDVELDLNDPKLETLLEKAEGGPAADRVSEAGRPADDPELRALVENWAEEVDIDDLDMDRWLPRGTS
ncbi:MAG: NYN domain-containing protein [Planctomycetota bacterium]